MELTGEMDKIFNPDGTQAVTFVNENPEGLKTIGVATSSIESLRNQSLGSKTVETLENNEPNIVQTAPIEQPNTEAQVSSVESKPTEITAPVVPDLPIENPINKDEELEDLTSREIAPATSNEVISENPIGDIANTTSFDSFVNQKVEVPQPTVVEQPKTEEVKEVVMPQMPTEVIANEPTVMDPNLFNLNTENPEPILENPVANLNQMEDANKTEQITAETPIVSEPVVSGAELSKDSIPAEVNEMPVSEPVVPNIPDISSGNAEKSIKPESLVEPSQDNSGPVLEETVTESVPSVPEIDDQIPALEAVENPLENKEIVSSNQILGEIPTVSDTKPLVEPAIDNKETISEPVSTIDNTVPSVDPTPAVEFGNNLVADTPFTIPTDSIVQTKVEEEKEEVIENESKPVATLESAVQESKLQNNDDINKQFFELKESINRLLDDFENRLFERKQIENKSEVVEEFPKFEIPTPDINKSADVEIPNLNTELPNITDTPVVPNVVEQSKEEIIQPEVSQAIYEPSEQLISGTKFGF